MPTVALYTLGCKVSQYETEAIAEGFERAGFTVVEFDTPADVYVINTCTVTAESDRKSRQFIRRAVAANPSAVVCALGCYTQRAPHEVSAIDGVSAVIGTADKLGVVAIAEQMLSGKRPRGVVSVTELSGAGFEKMTVTRAPRTRAYVKIEDGCESKCTYCAISAARGPVRSKPMEDIIAEVEGLYASGTREIVLTGIETGSWGRDLEGKPTLAELVRRLDLRQSCERIRLGSLAPELVGEEFAEGVAGCKILAPHFHLSMQSGSDSVLRAMRRRYNTEMAYKNIEALRRAVPGATFTTDMMVGFPGESEEDFALSADFVRRVGFLDVHVFAYSRREGTPAASYPDQVPSEIKKRRSAELIRIKNEARDTVLSAACESGKPLSCILETERDGVYTAHSDSFIEVSVTAPAGMQGEAVTVIPVSHKNGIIHGKLLV